MLKIPLFKPLLLLLIFLLVEAVLAGSGRLLTFGPLTLKMYLFLITLFVSVVLIFSYPLFDKHFFYLSSFFTLTLLVGSAIGINNGANLAYILIDLKPLIYFYVLLFLFISIKSYFEINLITLIIKKLSLFLAGFYLLILILLFSGIINFSWFYNFFSNPSFYSEIIFRGDQGCFFYKGFIFLVVGFIFYFFGNSKMKILPLFIFSLAMLGTQTRGFIVDVILVLLFYFIFIKKMRIDKTLLKILVISIPIIMGILYLYSQSVIGDRTDSDMIRYMQIEQVWEHITPFSFFLGHGFGIGVPIRDVHMEITYLEIFHKQGLLGLLFWGYFLYLPTAYFFQIKKISISKSNEVLPYYLSIIAIYVQSLTNPYLMNPIGLSICLISIVVMRNVFIFLKTDTK